MRAVEQPRTRSHAARVSDGALVAVLRSPLGRLFPGMTVVGYRGRRSGRSLSTPVSCVHTGDRVIIFVGRPGHKQWWRNVQADPEITVVLGGRDVPCRATVHIGDSPEAVEDLAAYLGGQPRMARTLGLSGDQVHDRPVLAAVASGAVIVRVARRAPDRSDGASPEAGSW